MVIHYHRGPYSKPGRHCHKLAVGISYFLPPNYSNTFPRQSEKYQEDLERAVHTNLHPMLLVTISFCSRNGILTNYFTIPSPSATSLVSREADKPSRQRFEMIRPAQWTNFEAEFKWGDTMRMIQRKKRSTSLLQPNCQPSPFVEQKSS